MSVSIQDVRKLLRQEHISCFTRGNGRVLLIPYGIDRQQVNIILNIREDGELLQFVIHDFLFLDRQFDRAQVYERLMRLNNQFIIGTLGLASGGDSITFEVALSVEDNGVTINQLRRIIGAMCGVCRNDRYVLQQFIDIGEDQRQVIDETVKKLLNAHPSAESTDCANPSGEPGAIDIEEDPRKLIEEIGLDEE